MTEANGQCAELELTRPDDDAPDVTVTRARPGPSDDDELLAIRKLVRLLNSLDAEARSRVMQYLVARYVDDAAD